MLHSYSQEYPWTRSQHRGFVDRLKAGSQQSINISAEYLDTKRRSYNAGYAMQFAGYLKMKYQGYTPNIIYVTDDNGYLFARDQLSKLYPDVPVIFSGVNDYGILDQIESMPIRGVFEKKEISQNLNLIRDLEKKNAEIVFIGDGSNTYDAIEAEIKRQLVDHTEINPVFLVHDNIDELIEALREHTYRYIFLTTIGGIKSANGSVLNPLDITEDIAAAADYIIITMEDAYFTNGVLGGYVTNGKLQGEVAAELALQLQSGASIDQIGNVTQSPNRYIFDQTELVRRNIKLPETVSENSLFYRIPPTFYERYRLMILISLAFLGALVAFLIGSIIISRIRKIRKERYREELRTSQLERYQNALIKWSGTSHADIREAFSNAAEISSATLEVKRVSIWLYNDARSGIECHALYVDGEGHSSGVVLLREDYPSYFEAMDSGRRLIIEDARTNPVTRELVDPYMLERDIYSMLDVPIIYDGKCIGVVCHEHTGSLRKWTVEEQEFCALIGGDISLSLEVDRRKSIEKNLEYHAFHDALTDLPNRALVLDRIDQAIRHARRERTLVAVLFLDLDNFKHVNDSFGHSVGDRVLITTASRLNSVLRDTDTVSRLGGDEFTILLDEFEKVDDLNDIAGKLLKVIQEPIMIDGNELAISTSIGISLFPDDGRNAETLLRNADAAMYRAKEKGRNSFEFYTEDMTARALDKIRMIASLKRAIEQDEFEVYYQPQVDIKEKRLIGLEALVRWNHPEQGLLSPAVFLPTAEESGLLVALDRWVMRRSLHQLNAWTEAGLEIGRLSLNLTMQQIDHPDFLEFLMQMMQETKCQGKSLAFEITEGQLMKNPQRTVDVLDRIAELGIKISVDDFGTGYSSLAYLKKLPVDILKIDREFIRDIPGDEDDSSIVRSVIAMAQSLKIEVLAEGVETAEQLDFLGREGCNLIQGYYFSRPVASSDVPGLIDIPADLFVNVFDQERSRLG